MKLHEGDYYLDKDGDYLKSGPNGRKASTFYLSEPLPSLLKQENFSSDLVWEAKEYLTPKEFFK